MIEMKVTGLTIDPLTEMPIIILKDRTGGNPLPIWVGLIEASAIACELEKIDLSRPMTHDLLKRLLDVLGARLVRVQITDLRENTYFASLVLEQASRSIEVDARPSDAIALALRVGCPILVAEKVAQRAREVDLRQRPLNQNLLDEESIRDFLTSLPEDGFGKWKM